MVYRRLACARAELLRKPVPEARCELVEGRSGEMGAGGESLRRDDRLGKLLRNSSAARRDGFESPLQPCAAVGEMRSHRRACAFRVAARDCF
jgi:hypothetical protein